MKEAKYKPDGVYYLINGVWEGGVFLCAIVGTLVLVTVKEYDMMFFSVTFFILAAWDNIFFSFFTIRRLDKKYLDRLLCDSRSAHFIVFPFIFSSETIIKLRWMRFNIYIPALSRWPSLQKLRNELIPEFEHRKDIRLIDKLLFWGHFVFMIGAVITGFLAM